MHDKYSTSKQPINELLEVRQMLKEFKKSEEESRRSLETLFSFKKALETMQLGVTMTDLEGRILYINPAEAQMHGYTVDELIDKNVRIFASPKLWRQMTLNKIKSMKRWKRESYNIRKDGSSFPVQLMSDVVTTTDGSPIGIVTTCEDITERKEAQKSLIESKERYELASRGANDGLWDWDLKLNRIYFSVRWKTMLGLEDHEIGTLPSEWFNLVHPADRKQMDMEISAHIDGLIPHFENELRMMHKDGRYRWMLIRGLAVKDTSGKAYRMAGSLTDITNRKETEKQLQYDALHDSLTGLPNRVLFMDRLTHAYNRSMRHDTYLFAVLFIDIDRFKFINDSLGHIFGDKLLHAISRRIEDSLRPSDSVARLGGDEFAILLEDITDINDSIDIAERIQDKLTLPFKINEHEVFSTASIGICLGAAGDNGPEDLLRNADIAMYHAKSDGRNCFKIYNDRMHTNVVDRLQLETDLRRAIERQEFILHYQPIVKLNTGKIIGFEALIRWEHPKRGLIFPQEFIPVAEETGLIIPIGEWVLNAACRDMKKWQVQFPMVHPLWVSINLSSKQFLQLNLIEHIECILQQTSLDASCLRLEITESVFMEDSDSATNILSQLRDMDIQLYIDDFGTGYSSLSYLHQFPVNIIKVDRSFAQRVNHNGDESEIIRAIVLLAHNLKMEVIAEGVESVEQLEHFKTLKCDYGQGYLFSKPISKEYMNRLFKSQIHRINYLI